MLRGGRLGGQPGGRDHRHPQRVVGAELDPVERLVDRGARAPRRRPRASRARPGARRARRGTAARASRPPARRRARAAPRAASRSSRPSASSAWRRRALSSELPLAKRRRVDAGERRLGGLPVAGVERVLRDRQREPDLPRRQRAELRRARRARRRAPRSVRPTRCSASLRFDRRGGDVLQVAALVARSSSARRSAAAPSSISPVAASDTPSALSAPGLVEVVSRPARRARACSAQRPAGDADRAVVARLQHQHAAPAARAGRRARGSARRRPAAPARARARRPPRPGAAAPTATRCSMPVEPCGAARLGRLVDERERPLGERDRAREVVGVEVARGGALEQVGLVGAGQRRGVGHAVPQLERALEQRGALAVGLHLHRGDAGAHGGRQRGRLVARGEVVVRDRGRALGARAARRRGRLLERARQRAVQLGALAGQQVVVHRLAQQRVAQRVAVAVEHDDLAGDRLAQRLAQRAPVEPGDLGEHRVVEPGRRRTARARPPARRRRAARSAARARPRGSAGARRSPSSPAASSSSVNSGLPSLRA